MEDENELDLRTRLNLETGRITWKEVEVFFARGMAMVIAPELDRSDEMSMPVSPSVPTRTGNS